LHNKCAYGAANCNYCYNLAFQIIYNILTYFNILRTFLFINEILSNPQAITPRLKLRLWNSRWGMAFTMECIRRTRSFAQAKMRIVKCHYYWMYYHKWTGIRGMLITQPKMPYCVCAFTSASVPSRVSALLEFCVADELRRAISKSLSYMHNGDCIASVPCNNWVPIS